MSGYVCHGMLCVRVDVVPGMVFSLFWYCFSYLTHLALILFFSPFLYRMYFVSVYPVRHCCVPQKRYGMSDVRRRNSVYAFPHHRHPTTTTRVLRLTFH